MMMRIRQKIMFMLLLVTKKIVNVDEDENEDANDDDDDCRIQKLLQSSGTTKNLNFVPFGQRERSFIKGDKM